MKKATIAVLCLAVFHASQGLAADKPSNETSKEKGGATVELNRLRASFMETAAIQCNIDCGDNTGGTVIVPDVDRCLRACEATCNVDACEIVE